MAQSPPHLSLRRLALPAVALLLLAATASAQIRVLIYHAHMNLGYTEERFRAQMDFLQANDYHTIRPAQLLDWMELREPLPIRPILLTVDDNYILLYTSMYPILAQRGQTITNFTITDSAGYEGSLHYCDWDEIREMEASGAVNSESHSRTHPHLTQITIAEAWDEILGSKTRLEQEMPGNPCELFAFPYGDYNGSICSLCDQAGYRAGFAVTVSGSDGLAWPDTPRFDIPRLGADWGDIEDFKSVIGFDQLPPAPPGDGWTIDNPDPNFYIDESAWDTALNTGCYGPDYRHRTPGDGSQPARWAAYLPREGLHRIYAWWPLNATAASNAVYQVQTPGGTQQITVDQRTANSQWTLLGTFWFSTDEPAGVRLLDQGDGLLLADAVWFEPAASEVAGWLFY
jgi:peptidoglycan/xylan/chitin deacetylase (PgdA/CDA1 family)